MDGYPAGSLDLNVPFLVVAGLTSQPPNDLPLDPQLQEQGILLRSKLPSLDTEDAKALRDYISTRDARDQPWNTQDQKPYRFRVGFSGRSFIFPPRRARLPDHVEPPELPPVLHSPFSPLNPVSPLYPDGLIDAQWLQKHQELVPSVYLCVYSLESDPTMATLHDKSLRTDINNIRLAAVHSGYKTRIAVLVLGDGSKMSNDPAEGMQERLDSIRRGVGLDTKSFFYIPTQDSPAELERATDSILSTLYTQSLEYYRDLGRHARKKRSRGVTPQPTVPPTTGTSQTLSLQGWNVRYDFKSAVFAEFRQEMDTALRSYDQAYDGILSQDVMDILPSWSPRWNEARLLTDVISIRAIRCALWNGQTTSAVKRWRAHRDRIADFVDRRGRGTKNYGWEAWQSRWALVMARLIEKADPSSLRPSTLTLFIPPEKIVVGEHLQPWEMLHHKGYWYRLAARHLVSRRRLAHAMPEEDRRAPGDSPASVVASRAYTYDTYLCPEPHEEYPLVGKGTDHSQLIIDCLELARSEFQSRKQLRASAEITLEWAKELARVEAWEDVVALLKPLWTDMSFRREGWLNIAEDLSWVLRAAAARIGLGDVVVSIDWELLNKQFTKRPDWEYDLSKSLEGVQTKSKPTIALTDDTVSSFVFASFIFKNEEGRAGETCRAQLTLTSHAFQFSAPVRFRQVRVDFDGSLGTIILDQETGSHPDSTYTKDDTTLSIVPLTENVRSDDDSEEVERGSVLHGPADLELKAGCTKAFEMAIPLREPGEARAASVELLVDSDAFALSYTISFGEVNTANIWFGPSLSTRRIPRPKPHAIQIQPRPPKVDITHINPLSQYYTDERIDLVLDIVNAEDADAVAKLEVHVLGDHIPAFSIELEEGEKQEADASQSESKLTNISLGTLGTSKPARARLSLEPSRMPMPYEITAKVTYHLVTDPITPIMQSKTFHIDIANPFEANYDFLPRLHPDPWPSLFDYEGARDLGDGDEAAAPAHPRCLAQKWCLVCHYASFASEDLQILELEAKVLACQPSARCISISQLDLPPDGLTIPPKSMQEVRFDMVVQKLSLDERGPASLDAAFMLKWRRRRDAQSGDGAAINTTTMPVPRSIVLGIEPRVLGSVSHGDVGTGLMQLDLTIENASGHFLTFGVTMEPSDEFAFSGAKQTTLHVLPISRRTISYRLLPLVRGCFVRPQLVVRDKYFQKVLRIIPTEDMKMDKDGLLIWVPPAPEEADGEESGRKGLDG
ncbi:hypothetical protein SODALDRAFT_315671 [Sodiomyces alkalinus F11]|uniref:Trafficking protein particle complex subunit 11 n=1 Tax=Sodiomyces alkalinus (strain CBS 110278 / VKM F-3762 / F11) TaxID=1314773 RepID=A0A3N2PQ44_SODAK|nr:hypothetical protein SODALDRAFT_315671 [Sodiomyces alkalinus F11]ROT36632.1 hypothetical protein SODALDRAFT_315671 [Sodiomyces alkalinus F11]